MPIGFLINMSAQDTLSQINTYEPLKKIFGYSSFRPNQEEIINAILEGRDIFSIMPTGGGKSLCYQLPASILPGACIVISPLISLMKDQVDGLQNLGISAEFLNSSQDFQEKGRILSKLGNGELSLLYIAPERFANNDFFSVLRSARISFFAIDEAHCISEWGHDFRPDYLSLSNIKKFFPGTPVSAFTATATKIVEKDIVQKLSMDKPLIKKASFDRPNLFLQVTPKMAVEKQILNFLKSRPNDSGIIYRMTRENVEQTSHFLNENSIRALPYHAGLDSSIRQRNQEAFNRDEIQVMVATIAFGMGIDKSNIRFVIHGDLPKNMESYYQEIGRAGRDGEPAHCVLYFKRGDIPRINYFLEQIDNEEEKQRAQKKLNQIINYAAFNSCRRGQILAYFDEQYPKENCASCDVCTDKVETVDATIEAQMVLSAIYRLNQRYGGGYITDIVTGANTKRIRELGHKELKTYGVGAHKNKNFWRSLIDELINRRHLEQTNDQYPVLILTKNGMEILRGEKKFQTIKKEENNREDSFIEKNLQLEYNSELFQRLRLLRKEVADQLEVPPYIIFSDRTLHEMSAFFPGTREELLCINGIGEQKLEKFGSDFLLAIEKFLNEFPEIAEKKSAIPLTNKIKRGQKKNEGETIETTKKLALENLTIPEIAKARGLAVSTISLHLEKLLILGEKIDLDVHIPPDRQTEIEDAFLSLQTSLLTPVYRKFKGKIPYEELQLIRGFLTSRGDL